MIIYSQKYYNKYFSIIKHYKELNLKKSKDLYTESHHIIPRSMGGTNNKDNLVRIPARVHFLLHWMLYRIYRTSAMACAWHMMRTHITEHRYTSKSFEYARIIYINHQKTKSMSAEARQKISASGKGRIVTNETRQKISAANLGNTHTDEVKRRISIAHTGKPLAASTKKKMSDASIGKPKTKQHAENISKARLGMKMSDATRQKMSDAQKLLPTVICPHCGKNGKGNIMKRVHFDKCKLKAQPQDV